MPIRVSELDEETEVQGEDLLLLTQYVSPGVYLSKKITYDNFLLDLNAFVQGGNAFGAQANFGTTDNQGISVLINNIERAEFTTEGTFIINNVQGAEAIIAIADSTDSSVIAASQNNVLGGTAAIQAENFSEDINASAFTGTMRNTDNDLISNGLRLIHLLYGGGIPQPGLGIGIEAFADSTTTSTQRLGSMDFYWTNAVHGDRTSAWSVSTVFDATTEEERLAVLGRNTVLGDVSVYAGIGDGEGLVIVVEAEDPPSGTSGGFFQMWSESDIPAGVDNIPHFMNGNGHIIRLYTTNAIAGAYSIVNETPDRSYDADATSVAELADVLATLIGDLKNTGLIL